VFAVRRHHKLALTPLTNAVLLHQSSHPLFSYLQALGQQLLVNLAPPIFAFDLGVDDANRVRFSGATST
jgi:hypothetical protein